MIPHWRLLKRKLRAGPFQMGLQDVVSGLSDNPYFGAGFGLFGVGMAAGAARKAAQVGMIMFRRHCMTTVEVTCKDRSYPWLLQWIATRGDDYSMWPVGLMVLVHLQIC